MKRKPLSDHRSKTKPERRSVPRGGRRATDLRESKWFEPPRRKPKPEKD